MRVILETITGRKGIKNFSSLEEYVDFMTKNGDKIKNIVESDLPYDDKPVSVATPSQSNGWEQVNKATFGDVIKKAEKGDCVLPHKTSSVFKDEAKFEPSKTSEKADSQNDVPQFNYEDNKQSSEPKEEKKVSPKNDDSKSETKESPKSEENEDKKEIKESLDDESLEEGFKDKFKKAVATGAMAASLAAGNAHGMTQDPYYNGATRPYEDSYEQVSDYEKPQIKQVKSDGTIVDQYGNEYTKEQFEALLRGEDPFDDNDYHPELNTNWMNEIEECLRIAGVQLDESVEEDPFETALDCVNSAMDDFGQNDDNYLRSVCEDCAKEYGVDVRKLYQAYTGHKWSALDKDDIYESLDDSEINPQVLKELYDIISENFGRKWLANPDEVDFMEVEDAVDDFGREIDGYDESLRNAYANALIDSWGKGGILEDVNNPKDGEVDEKSGKEKLFEEDPSANFNQDEVDDLMSQYERAESDYHAADFYDDNYSWRNGRSSASSRMSDIEKKLKELTGKSYKELLDTLGSKQVDDDKGPSFNIGDKVEKNGKIYQVDKVEKQENKSRDHQYTNYWYHVHEVNGSYVDVFTDSLMKQMGWKPVSK